jgi:hypothetical protein
VQVTPSALFGEAVVVLVRKRVLSANLTPNLNGLDVAAKALQRVRQLYNSILKIAYLAARAAIVKNLAETILFVIVRCCFRNLSLGGLDKTKKKTILKILILNCQNNSVHHY